MKKLLKELFMFCSASACAGVLALFIVWQFLVYFPFEWLSGEPQFHEHVPAEVHTLTSSTLSEAETKTYYGNEGRVDFARK